MSSNGSIPFNTDPRQLMGTKEAAEFFGVTSITLMRWTHQGLIAHARMPSGQFRFSRDWCRAYLESSVVPMEQ